MDIKEIQNLIKFVAKSGASEVKLEMEDVKITIKTGPGYTETTYLQAAPVSQVVPPVVAPTVSQLTTETAATASETAENTSNYITIKSPIIGTFYRKPSPDKPNFVDVGSEINE